MQAHGKQGSLTLWPVLSAPHPACTPPLSEAVISDQARSEHICKTKCQRMKTQLCDRLL